MRSVWFQRLLAGLLLVWTGILQFPLPQAAPTAKDLSTPFPCMNRACGCRSADECWRSCCCTTKAERIAFAEKHLGHIPAALADAADKPAVCSHSCCSMDRPSAKPLSKSKSNVVVFAAVLKCRGLTAGWSIFSAAVPPPIPQTLALSKEPRVITRPGSESAASTVMDTPTPPPRRRDLA
jgi:hypothetical protein